MNLVLLVIGAVAFVSAQEALPTGAATAEISAKEGQPVVKAPVKTSASQNGQTLREKPARTRPDNVAPHVPKRLGQVAGTGTPAVCEHAINTKGTGATGRVAADHAIDTKGTGATGAVAIGPGGGCDGGSASAREDQRLARGLSRPAPREALLGGRCAAADHAINTKGTGVAGRTGPGGDCDDTNDPSESSAKIQPTKAGMAIKTKGTGAQ